MTQNFQIKSSSDIAEQINRHGVNAVIPKSTLTEKSTIDIGNDVLAQINFKEEKQTLPSPFDGIHPKFRDSD